eukprot:TRINITY_DN7316_c0_g1_i3.p1 TRINITY_DN7316_c0_g1~~TRINITY_DN7316_c0_g1_i3.p1  ORF type:complete len:411 (-),score=28.66 TRINITY_DN7316_c0_g1_i3:242-1474(-)
MAGDMYRAAALTAFSVLIPVAFFLSITWEGKRVASMNVEALFEAARSSKELHKKKAKGVETGKQAVVNAWTHGDHIRTHTHTLSALPEDSDSCSLASSLERFASIRNMSKELLEHLGEDLRWALNSCPYRAQTSLLLAALDKRCSHMQQPNGYSNRHMVFTHIPKAGGTSFQDMLGPLWRTHNKVRPCDVWAMAKSGNLSRATVHGCSLLMGHANIALEEDLKSLKDFMYVTIFRDPAIRAESYFRYHGNKGRQFIEQVLARHGSLQDEFEKSYSKAPDEEAFWMHAPQEMFEHGSKRRGPGELVWGRPRTSSLKITFSEVIKVLEFITRRFGVVGVLERSRETMKVLHCRVPWINQANLPHTKKNAQTWEYPMKLKADSKLMSKYTWIEKAMFDWANILLSYDMRCCHR